MEQVRTMSIMEKAVALMKADLFKTIPTDEVALIAARTTEVRFREGEQVPQTGEAATSFFFVIEGKAEQLRGNVVVRRAGAGQAFGLLGLVGIDEPEVASTRISEDTHAIALTREAFFETVGDHPAFAIAFIRAISQSVKMLATRTEELEKKLAELEGRDPDGGPREMM